MAFSDNALSLSLMMAAWVLGAFFLLRQGEILAVSKSIAADIYIVNIVSVMELFFLLVTAVCFTRRTPRSQPPAPMDVPDHIQWLGVWLLHQADPGNAFGRIHIGKSGDVHIGIQQKCSDTVLCRRYLLRRDGRLCQCDHFSTVRRWGICCSCGRLSCHCASSLCGGSSGKMIVNNFY